MKILFVLHADFEGPGALETWANQQTFETKCCRPFDGEMLPSVNEFDWLVIMGGPQSPLELDRYPYLKLEVELIKRALSSDKVVLGFCLGAQLIGEALGAMTQRSPHKEIGVFPIRLTQEGCDDPLLESLPQEFPVVHWHNDMPGLTEAARVLATSKGCPRQIVKYSEKAYGFQCHLEPSLQDIKGMIKNCEADLKPGLYIQSEDDLLSSDYITINNVMHHILDNLLKVQESLVL